MSIQKITLNGARDIPLNKLVLSQTNVRRTKAGVSIEDLAEDIAHRKLLQSLSVRPVLDGDGQETGMYEVPAGGRRYRALQLLVKQKRLTKTSVVPCIVKAADDPISAVEDSLAENAHRLELHPLDQFRAFQTLRNQGLGEEEIAARFFVSPATVQKRLKLASVSDKLLFAYAEDQITLEQLMAFTVTNDHAQQEQVWDSLTHTHSKEPYVIRRLLTQGAVEATDKRAQFVGSEAYETAGGIITRDLFEDDDGGWFQDSVLLTRLSIETLQAEAEKLRPEGWKWITIAIDFPYGNTDELRELTGDAVDLSDEERGAREALRNEFDRLENEYAQADEYPDEVDQRLGEIERALAAFENRPMIYDPDEIARAGVFVSIGGDGELCVERGYVRPEDEAPQAAGEDGNADADAENPSGSAVQRTVITIGGQADEDEDEGDTVKSLPDRLVSELTAYRTLALRNAVANNPHVAMTALLHKLCRDTFDHPAAGACLEAFVREVHFPIPAPDLKDSISAKAVAVRHAAWKAELPQGEIALWDRLAQLDESNRLNLLAHCVSFGVNALHEKGGFGSPHGVQRRLVQADRLARAVGLDMVAAGWRPTADNYLSRVTKPRILEAVREAKGEASAQLIDHLKKGEMAKEAERLLDGTGWLPEPLRLLDESVAETESEEAEALPEFLAEDEDDEGAAHDEASHDVAAE